MEVEPKERCEYLDEYKIIRTIGTGFSADVKLALDPHGRQVAIKQFKQGVSSLASLKAEMLVMRELAHENLLTMVTAKESAIVRQSGEPGGQTCCAIVVEYAAGGELFDFVAQTGQFSERVARTLFQQLVAGLQHMHERGFAHRDIKVENLLLTAAFTLKVADFGFSCLIKGRAGTGTLRTRLGTQGYMAPEIGNSYYDGSRTDVFAAGVVLFIMYAGSPPFENANACDHFYNLIREKRFGLFWKVHSRKRPLNFFSESFKDLIQRMLACEPNDRPTLSDVAEHPWVTGPICSPQEMIAEFGLRKKRLEDELGKQRERLEEEQKLRMQQVRNQGSNSRGGELEDWEFITTYEKESLKGLKLRPLEQFSPLDILVNSTDCAFIIAHLKCFLRNHRIALQDEGGGECSEDELFPSPPRKLECMEVTDEGEGVRVRYEYKIEIEEETFPCSLLFTVELGLNPQAESVLHFGLLAGSDFYLRMAVSSIRLGCFP